MATPVSDSPLAILTFIAAPAVFTNAASVLALGTGNRLARVVDRTREISTELHKESGNDALNQMYLRQLGRLDRRAEVEADIYRDDAGSDSRGCASPLRAANATTTSYRSART